MAKDTDTPTRIEPLNYSISVAANEIGGTEAEVRRLIAKRELITFTQGHRELIRADVLDAFLYRRAAAAKRMAGAGVASASPRRAVNRLTADDVWGKVEPGRYSDGGGLYLDVPKSGSRYWILRYQLNGRRRDLTLGAVTAANDLAAARLAAHAARDLIARGVDPIDERRQLKLQRQNQRPPAAPTLAEHSRAVIKAMAPGWRGDRTTYAWELSLLKHAAKIGKLPVNKVHTADVLRVLEPIWATKAASAIQLRGRLERVLDHARVAGHITGPWDNPARWHGHLALLLPKPERLQRGRMRAISYEDAPAVMARLRALRGLGPRALEFTVLTAAREGMVIGAKWSEVQGDVWVVPADRMKDGKEFCIPLSPAALAVLARTPGQCRDGYIFKGSRNRRGGHISGATMDRVCSESLGIDASPHGFRSTFRDWAGDCTEHPREVAEMCLAHVVGNETERAYRRADALAKRRVLMEDWATYLRGGHPDGESQPPAETQP